MTAIAAEPSKGNAPIEFIDLGAWRRRLGARLDDAIAAVAEHGRFILGLEVKRLENALAEFCGVKHVADQPDTHPLIHLHRSRSLAPPRRDEPMPRPAPRSS